MAPENMIVNGILSLRRLRRYDIETIAAIVGNAFGLQEVEKKVAEELTIYCDDGLEELSIGEQRQALPREYYVVLVSDQPAGLTGRYRFHWAWEGEAWIGWTAIDTPRQSQGIGSSVLSALMTIAQESGFRILHVETERDGRAKNFYFQNGFKESGVLPCHYGSNFDALVLSRDLRIYPC